MADKKKGTVTYVDGKTIGINTGGRRETDGPNKDKLVTDETIDVREASLNRDGAANVKPSQVVPGDSIEWGGGNGRVEFARLTAAKPTDGAPEATPKGHPAFGPATSNPNPPSGHTSEDSAATGKPEPEEPDTPNPQRTAQATGKPGSRR